MTEAPAVQLLTWDTDFFGVRIARLGDGRLTAASMSEVAAQCQKQQIECLHYLADAEDTDSVRLAEENGFHLVDVRITLERQVTPQPAEWRASSEAVRLANDADIPELRTIAAANHRDSRFYHDGGFPLERCDELYATWIEKSCQGFADAVLAVQREGRAVGYLSCHLRGTESGQIGLVGVSSDWQGHGMGKLLLEEALRWFAAAGVSRLEVVTQGRNIAAQRLYQKSAFLTCRLQLWYHRWFQTREEPGKGGAAR